MRNRVCQCGGWLLAAALLVPLGAQASAFQVNPIRVTLSRDHATAVVRVTNDGATPKEIELQIVAWSQKDGRDLYIPSRNLLATPPIFIIPAQQRQIVRIGMRGTPNPRQETAYRLFFTEIPPPPKLGFRGLQIMLRIGIPVFVEPAVATEPVLQWSANRASATEVELTATNTGTAHSEILRWTLSGADHHLPLAAESGGYVLPGATHSWMIKLARPWAVGKPMRVVAHTDQGILHAHLVLKP